MPKPAATPTPTKTPGARPASHPGGDRAIPGARDLPPADSIFGVKPGSAHGDSYRAAPDFDGNEHADTDASGDAHADGDRDASPDDDAHNDSHGHADPDIDSYADADDQPQPVRGEIAYASARSRPDRQPAQRPRLGSTTDPTWRETDPCAGEARPGLLAVSPGEVVRRGRAAFRREAPHLYGHARCVRQPTTGRANADGYTRRFGDPGIYQHRGQARRALCGQLSDVRRRASLSGAAVRRRAGGRSERPGAWQPRRS